MDDGVVCAGVVDVIARMDDETAELIDESTDEDSTELAVVAGALVVVVWAAVVDMMDVLLAEEMGVEVELVREEVVVAATPARAKD